MSAATVRPLTPDDLERAKAIRRECLELHPEAFSSDSDREAPLTSEQWKERLGSRRWFGAFVGETLVGVAAWIPGPTKKTAHTVELGGMYVRESARGSGAADALVEAVLASATAHADYCSLTVNAENPRAIRLYERHGFALVGRMPKALRVGGRDYDELFMWRSLKAKE
jgi:ribosomal protein S18 acetylase RimI-like enzyme